MFNEEIVNKRLAELSEAKQALLEKRLKQTLPGVGEMPEEAIMFPLLSETEAAHAPLSFMQQSLWFLQHFDPESTAYNECTAVSLRGPLDYEALARASQEIMRRHTILRSTFPLVDGQVVQVVDQQAHERFTLPMIDLSHSSPDEREAKVQCIVAEKMRHPFRLSEELPWFALLLRLHEQEHIALMIMHHIITDGWSSQLFLREIGALYSAFHANQPSPLPEPATQYADYARWQRRYAASGALASQSSFWREQLREPLPVLELPTDHPRPGIQTYHGQKHALTLPPALLRSLESLSLQEGATLFMTLLAALNVLLFRYTSQGDILIGSPIAGRTRPELEELLGCFVNTLVFRTNLSGVPTFRALLAQVREVTLGAFDHQDIPFEQLVEELQPERSLSHSPIFQVMLTLQNMPVVEQKIGDLTVSPLTVEHTTAKYDLLLTLGKTEAESLEGFFEYNVDLFEAPTIARLARHFTGILEQMTRNIDQPIDSFALLTEAELQQQTITWNRVEVPYGLEQGYAERFAEQARRTPEALAVSCGKEQLTYRQLDRRANALAQRLREEGIGPEKLVAVLDQREVPWAIALLAIWKAGGAYLPLDPAQPVSRLRQMIRQSDCGLLLVGPAFAARLQSVLDEFPAEQRPAWQELRELEEEAEQGPELCWQGRQLAYVIYTSGSTGQPKGAMVEQAGMLNHVLAKVAELELHAGDCVAQTASQCFDISLWQLLAVWLVGGRVCIFSQEQAHDPQRLLAEVQRVEVTILEIVPSLLRALLEVLERGTDRVASSLRWLLLTGEGLPVELCQRWFALSPGISLLNSYGPTECSDNVTHQQIRQASELAGPLAPLGYPLPNTRLYILDAAGQPVPVGVSGELWIGGKGVGRGYVGDGRRTAEVFRPDPFGEGGQRLYRSGDLARYRAEGQIEFLGRMDQQVKLRGYRIELGEIEAVLRKHEAVRDCVVVVRAEGEADPRLLAYVVLGKQNLPRRSEVQDFLAEHLPEYMIPHTFIILDELPLNSRGKIDRKALPSPEESEFTLDTMTYVAPRTPLEQALATIWAEVLEVGRVGIEDNFFELGGHSLLIAQILGRVRDDLQIELPFRVLFTSPTIAALANLIERLQMREAELRRPAVAPVARETYRVKRVSMSGEGV